VVLLDPVSPVETLVKAERARAAPAAVRVVRVEDQAVLEEAVGLVAILSLAAP
jgi:hypothetical protein